MDRLDEFFNNKMNERKVPFDEAHWQEAQQMLDQRDRRRRGIIWWWVSGMALVLLLVGLLLWWNRPADQPAAPEGTTATESNTTKNTGPRASNQGSDAEASIEPSTERGQQSFKEETTPAINKGQIETTGSDQEVSISGDSDVIENQEEGVGENESSHKKGIKDNEAQEDIIPTLVPEIADDQLPEKTKEQAPPIAAIDAVKPQKLEKLSLLPSIDPDELEWLRDLPKMKVESVAPPVVPQKLSSWELALAATANPGEGKTFPAGTAQLQYNYSIYQHYNIYASVGYRFLDGTFAATQESNRQAYGFGLSVERYQLTPSRLHYLTAGLGLAKKWKRHRLQAGMAYQYLLGVQGTLSKSEKPEFASIFTNADEAGSGWMDKDGFRQYLLGGELGYQLRVWGPLSVQCNLQYWFNDLLEEEYEPPSDEVLQERGPLFIDLGISYRL